MESRRVGRYVIGHELAAGGMATVHLGRMQGPAGFGKTVAIKVLHAQFAKDSEFRKMFLDEARVTSGLMHPNIVMTLDILDETDGLYLVMEYVHGASLAVIHREIEKGQRYPLRIVSAITSGFLEGLHAAHNAMDDNGDPLNIVHRDVSPQNVLVSFAGIAKIADFGIAKAAGNMHSTGDGSAKGKLSYMAPEQVNTQPVTPRTDVYAAGIVLWEMLTRTKLVAGGSAAERVRALLELEVKPPSQLAPDIPPALDAIVMRALEKDPANRYPDAKAMASDLQKAVSPASSIEVGDWLRENAPELVRERDAALTQLQRLLAPSTSVPTQIGAFAPASTPRPMPVSEPTPVSSPRVRPEGETSAGNVSILTRSEKDALPPKMPRPVLAALIGLPVLGLIGAILVMITVTRRKPAQTEPAKPPVSVAAAVDPVPSPPPVDHEETAPAASASASATPSAATTKPKPASTATTATPPKNTTAGKKCRIVATPDKSGRMKFEEVCTP